VQLRKRNQGQSVSSAKARDDMEQQMPAHCNFSRGSRTVDSGIAEQAQRTISSVPNMSGHLNQSYKEQYPSGVRVMTAAKTGDESLSLSCFQMAQTNCGGGFNYV